MTVLDTSVPDSIMEHSETLAVFRALGIDDHGGGKSLEFARNVSPLGTD